jgi:hypothetical protein
MRNALALKDWSWQENPPGVTVDAAITESIQLIPPAVSRASPGSAPSWVEGFMNEASQLMGLRRNWDGRGSSAIKMEAISFAYSVLGRSMTPTTIGPAVIPMSNGGVQLVWAGQTAAIEVEVVNANEATGVYINHTTGVERELKFTTEFSVLSNLLRTTFTP